MTLFQIFLAVYLITVIILIYIIIHKNEKIHRQQLLIDDMQLNIQFLKSIALMREQVAKLIKEIPDVLSLD